MKSIGVFEHNVPCAIQISFRPMLQIMLAYCFKSEHASSAHEMYLWVHQALLTNGGSLTQVASLLPGRWHAFLSNTKADKPRQ